MSALLGGLRRSLAPRVRRGGGALRFFAALGDHYFGADGALVADPVGVDHFTLLGVAVDLDVEAPALDDGLRKLQRRLHPDRFATAAAPQRALAEAASARVNDAVSTLRAPLPRYDYCLSLRTGRLVLDDETVGAPPALLMRVMEAREAVDDAEGVADLEGVLAENDLGAAAATDGLRSAYAAGDDAAAAERIVELNFFGKILEEARAVADANDWELPKR